jgi:adenylate kinase
MRLLATGISGVAKLEALEQVARYLKEKKNQDLEIFDVWTHIQKVAKNLRIQVTKEKILDDQRVDFLRPLAFEDISKILAHIPNGPTSHSVIVTHGCFRWNKYLRRGFDVHYLNQIDPDVYVNIIDDIHLIKSRLEQDSQWKERLSAPEVITWRDEETFLTETFAEFQRKSFYLLARSEPPETLGNLIGEPAMKKIYLSYPITAIEKQKPELLQEAEQFADELRSKFVVFNPLSIKDLVAHGSADHKVTTELRENTVWRDFKLIAQSDMVVVYYPVEFNSPGVNQEIAYGFGHGKAVYLYYPHSLSPFWGKDVSVTARFDTFEGLRNYLLKEL